MPAVLQLDKVTIRFGGLTAVNAVDLTIGEGQGSVRAAQIMPTSWVRFMKASSAQDPAYGGQLWLNKRRPAGSDQVLFPDKAPSDVFAALGHLGQFVVVSPQHRLTIVRLGKTQDDQLDPINAQLARLIDIFPKY